METVNSELLQRELVRAKQRYPRGIAFFKEKLLEGQVRGSYLVDREVKGGPLLFCFYGAMILSIHEEEQEEILPQKTLSMQTYFALQEARRDIYQRATQELTPMERLLILYMHNSWCLQYYPKQVDWIITQITPFL